MVDHDLSHVPYTTYLDDNMRAMCVNYNTTSLIQMMNLEAISAFTKQTFNVLFVAFNNPVTSGGLNAMNATRVQGQILRIPLMNAVWRKICPELIHMSGQFRKPAMECCVKAENDVEMVVLWRWLSDKGFEDLQPYDILDLIKSVCCRPGRAEDNILPAEEEEGETVPVNLLTVSKFQKALKTFHDSITFLHNLDSNYEHL